MELFSVSILVAPPMAMSCSAALILDSKYLTTGLKHPKNCINDGLKYRRRDSMYQELCQRQLRGVGETEYGPGEGIEYSWSGIISLSDDGVLSVGELPGKATQWMCWTSRTASQSTSFNMRI
ncbi:hypothetical protein BU25DRAFT_473803 [Macroventuria anomochaeta]|uniref:Uncharacterized protein n=1 Tax=Macroventuria anomochaeta TaxID=301207 RepID=A0ACB6RT65_9PLEO|nr:uncharacterized protein BU25DRAFT_473803 [Macroventuria anomochaeta]KAF2625251.1 hypothetical protein BU25DRAFT_473803 [Macroventuria anomochaeta]